MKDVDTQHLDRAIRGIRDRLDAAIPGKLDIQYVEGSATIQFVWFQRTIQILADAYHRMPGVVQYEISIIGNRDLWAQPRTTESADYVLVLVGIALQWCDVNPGWKQ